MKKSILSIAAIMCIVGLSITSCGSAEENVETAKENVDEAKVNADKSEKDLEAAKAKYKAEYDKFKLESEAELSANEKLIADLKQYSATKKKEVKIAYEKTILELELKNQEMKEKINIEQEEDSTKWQNFKTEFNHDMHELGQAIKGLTENNSK